MIVQCAKCGTKFRLDETKIGQRGAKVRCSKCQHSFVVKRPPPVDSPVAPPFDSDTNPTATKPSPLDAAATVPGTGFGADGPSTDLTPGPGFDGGAAPITDRSTAPPARDPRVPGPPPPSAELPEMPTGDWAQPPPRDPIHEVQTAIYTVPDSIREAALKKEDSTGGMPGPRLSAADVAAIDLDADDDRTGIVPPELLAQAKAAAAAPPEDDIPELLDDDEVTLVSDDAPRDPAAGLDALPGDPFAAAPLGGGLPMESAGGFDALPADPFAAGLPEDPFAAPGQAIARIEPAVVGGDTIPEAEVPPARVAKPPPAAAREVADGRKGWSIGVKVVTTIVGVAILGVGVLLWLGGGRLDLSVIGLGATGKVKGKVATHYKDVYPVAMRSVLYPTRSGKQVLVFVGSAENRAGETRKNIAAVAELRNRKGELVASAQAPVGLALGPADLARLTDRESLKKAYADVAADQGEPALPSRGVAPFTVVLLQPPKGLAGLEHAVRLAKGEPVAAPKKAEPAPPEPAPEEAALDAGDEEDRKGKRKRKGKRRRRKGKAKAEDEVE